LERFGIVAFAFGYRKDGPGTSNRALARVVERLMIDYPDAVVVLQHEILDCLYGFPHSKRIHFVRWHKNSGQYLDSEEVMRQAAEYFNEAYVKKIFIVAQPFLHLHECISLAKQSGFEPVVPTKMKIPFDKQSEQEWTRSRTKLLAYAIKQKLLNQRGK